MTLIPTVGKVRRSQAVSTFGVGTIVDFTAGSFMPLGLDEMEWQWARLPAEAAEATIIYEPRLQKLLHMRMFRSVPIPGDREISQYGDRVKPSWAVPCVRFPSWLECQKCHRLGTVNNPFSVEPDHTVKCLGCGVEVNPVRFVTACRKGHIDDFPWRLWAHSKREERCENPILYLRSHGKSAALGDMYVKCATCGAERSLNDIFIPGALRMVTCRGKRPWLNSKEECGAELTALQRGGSNVHFPIMASALSIPPASEAIAKILERHWPVLGALPESAIEPTLAGVIEREGLKIRLASALSWVKRRKNLEEGDECLDERSARLQEYEALSNDCLPLFEGGETPEFENHVSPPPPSLHKWFDRISSATRLREVRAYCGFSRIEPWPVAVEKISESVRKGLIAPIAIKPINWRPAIEVRGEGIFFRLNEETLLEWSGTQKVQERAKELNEMFMNFCAGRQMEPPHRITPRLLLVHSLAHILIRRLSLDSGYSSASLRERLYIDESGDNTEAMAGILIYTASPDSDGSLGGLVSMSEPEKIEKLICQAIRDAFWCGNDPVCIETEPRTSGERLAGASCHNCLLVPETACEKFNKELDRSMLVGLEEKGMPGYFSDFSEDRSS